MVDSVPRRMTSHSSNCPNRVPAASIHLPSARLGHVVGWRSLPALASVHVLSTCTYHPVMNIDDVLGGCGGLEAIQRALSGSAARSVLRAAVSELIESARLLGACRLQRAKYRTGRYLAAYYEVTVGDHRRPIAVTWTPQAARSNAPTFQGVPAGSDPTEREAIERGLASPFRRLVTEVRSCGMRIQVAPTDAKFPQLVRVSDPAHVPTVLAAAGIGIPHKSSVTAIRYRPGRRHLLRYDTARANVFVKLYRDGNRAARACRVAVGIADRLQAVGVAEGRMQAGHPRVHAVRPLVVIDGDAVVAYPRVVGTPLSRQLVRAHADVGRQLAATGAALGVLHRDPEGLTAELEPHSFANEAEKVESACEHIHTLLPKVGRRITAILARARELHDALPQEPPTFVYGDFKADHLWVTRGGLVLIDFDTCRLADPALDVGKFLADLQWWHDQAGSVAPFQAEAYFLDAYRGPSQRLLRARIYEAVMLVKITAHRVQLFERNWAQRTARLVDRAEAVLAQLEDRIGVPGSGTTSSWAGRE
jgi:hypothetical protein